MEIKGTDQLCGYRKADLRLCFSHMQKKTRFSHDEAHIVSVRKLKLLQYTALWILLNLNNSFYEEYCRFGNFRMIFISRFFH